MTPGGGKGELTQAVDYVISTLGKYGQRVHKDAWFLFPSFSLFPLCLVRTLLLRACHNLFTFLDYGVDFLYPKANNVKYLHPLKEMCYKFYVAMGKA